MPFRDLKLAPGVNTQASPLANTFQLVSSNLIRYYLGLLQKLGGWTQITMQTFIGTCRGLLGWADISGNAYLAIGTEQRLQVATAGVISDITPIYQTDNPAVAFSTQTGQTAVVITDAGNAPSVGDWINLLTHVAVGGLVLNGFYQIVALPSGTTFTVNAASAATGNVTNAGAVAQYTTTNTQSTVKVTLAAHGLVTGSTYTPGVSTTVGGITVVAGTIYAVTLVDANNFNISVTGTATSSTNTFENSGNAQIQYLLQTGHVLNTSLGGYGAGQYGGGQYGGANAATAPVQLRQWSLDHFGQILIASPSNGKIYTWTPPTPAPATVIANDAPLQSAAVFVFPDIQIIIALGAEVGGTQQPLLARWSDQGNIGSGSWTASAINQAGSFFLSTGNKLVGGLAIGLGAAAVWTDLDYWLVSYLGFPLVFSWRKISSNCGLIAQRAAGIAGSNIMWLSNYQFFAAPLGGVATPVECPVWDFYWNNVDRSQSQTITCAVNSSFNEIAWFFPILTSSPLYSAATPYGYVKFNYAEPGNVWDFGLSAQLQRTAWTGSGPLGTPIGADIAGLLQQHEAGNDANGQAMMWAWQPGFSQLGEGEEMVFSDMIIPDWAGIIGSPTFVPNFLVQEQSNSPPQQVVIQNIATPASLRVTYAARGRQMSPGFQASAGDVGTFWRIGLMRIRYSDDGRF